jgi:hypothetical protein
MKKAIALSLITVASTLLITACTPTSRLHVGSEAPKIEQKHYKT